MSLFIENMQEPPHSAAATTLLRLSPTVRGDTLNIISVMELLSAPRANVLDWRQLYNLITIRLALSSVSLNLSIP